MAKPSAANTRFVVTFDGFLQTRTQRPSLTHGGVLEETAHVVADVWRLRGGFAAAAAALRGGSPAMAVEAAQALGALIHDPGAAEELDRDGTARALLKLMDTPNRTIDEVDAVEFALTRFVELCPSGAAQVVTAYEDPDHVVAFTAIRSSKWLLTNPATQSRMLQAGAARGVVTALSHWSWYCRTAACHAASAAERDPKILHALMDAGLLSALVVAIGDGGNRPPRSKTVMPHFSQGLSYVLGEPGQVILLPGDEASLFACTILANLIDGQHSLAVEVCKTAGLAASLFDCLKSYSGTVKGGPVRLINLILCTMSHDSNSPEAVHKMAFCKALSDGGFFRGTFLTGLIKLKFPMVTRLMCLALGEVMNMVWGSASLPTASVPQLAVVVGKYIEDGKDESIRASATAVLSVLLLCNESGVPLPEVMLTERLLRNVARVLVTGDAEQACCGLNVIVDQLQRDHFLAALEAAASGGFVLGCFRLLREMQAGSLPADSEGWEELLRISFVSIAEFSREQYVQQAVKRGLYDWMKYCLTSRDPYRQEHGLALYCGLLRFPESVGKMEEAGLFPGLLLKAIESNDENFLYLVVAWLLYMLPRASPHVAEVLDARVVRKVKQARNKLDRRFTGLRLMLGKKLAELERLKRLGPDYADKGDAPAGDEWGRGGMGGSAETLRLLRRCGMRGSSGSSDVMDKPLAEEVTVVLGPLGSHVRGSSSAPQAGNGVLVARPAASSSRSSTSGRPASASRTENVQLGARAATLANGGAREESGGPEAPTRTSALHPEPPAESDDCILADDSPAGSGKCRGVVEALEELSTCQQGADAAGASKQADAAGGQQDPGITLPRRSKKGLACANCGAGVREGMRLDACSGCMAVHYCGQACQRSHWPAHKAQCKRKQAKRAG